MPKSSEPEQTVTVTELTTNEPDKIIIDPVTAEIGPEKTEEGINRSSCEPDAGENKARSNPAKSKGNKRGKKTAASYAIEFFIKIGITALVVVILCVFVVGIHVNHGNSSYPMIKDGDLVITYKLSELQAGQEIAYRKDGNLRLGRIVAMEGDEVQISDQSLMVNGYGILEDTVYPTTAEGAAVSFPYVVPDGTVFVLNDFRSDVNDSRTFGAIPLPDCEGEVVFILRRRGI